MTSKEDSWRDGSLALFLRYHHNTYKILTHNDLHFIQCTHSIDMPVPSSYNDITQDVKIRDHIGWAWYQRSFFVPKTWKAQRVSLRFGSVNYHAIVVSSTVRYEKSAELRQLFHISVGQWCRSCATFWRIPAL